MNAPQLRELEQGVAFKLNGAEVVAGPDETILEAADRLGVAIPRLCYKSGMRPDGNCRACMVEIKGERVLAPSCCRQPTAGMEVESNSQRAVHSVVAPRQERARRHGKVGRVGGAPVGVEAEDGAVGELERGGEAGVDLKMRRGDEGEAGVGAGRGGRDVERGRLGRRAAARGRREPDRQEHHPAGEDTRSRTREDPPHSAGSS